MLTLESKTQWALFLSGDEIAYSWIYRAYIQPLYRFGLRFTSDGELVKDCIQDVFTQLYKNRSRLSTPDNVKVYLFVSLKNNLIRSLQKESFYDHTVEHIPFSFEPTVEEQFIRQEQDAGQQVMVSKILSQLTPRQQEIIYYRYIQELSFEEICQLMDMNYQSAQNLIQRSIKKIRDTYDNPLSFTLFCTALQQWINN